MSRTLGALLLATLLAGCGGPVFVPEAGPGAPGYRETSAPPPPAVKLVGSPGRPAPEAGGVVDTVVNEDGAWTISGWALVDADEPRGVLRVVLPEDVRSQARLGKVLSTPRPDVVDATSRKDLLWAGFTLTLEGDLPAELPVCVLSRSKQGTFRLAGSDDGLCPA